MGSEDDWDRSDGARRYSLAGLPGPSDLGADYDRLYLSRDQQRYVDYPRGAVIDGGDVPVDQAPFKGEAAAWVDVRPGADVHFTRAPTSRPGETLDFVIRLREPDEPWLLPWTDWISLPCTRTRGYRPSCKYCDEYPYEETLWPWSPEP